MASKPQWSGLVTRGWLLCLNLNQHLNRSPSNEDWRTFMQEYWNKLPCVLNTWIQNYLKMTDYKQNKKKSCKNKTHTHTQYICPPHRHRYKILTALVFLWVWTPVHMAGGQSPTRHWLKGAWRERKALGGRRWCWGGLDKGITDVFKHKELSTLQVSFRQCDFCRWKKEKKIGKKRR